MKKKCLFLIESDVSVVIAARLIVLRPTLSPFTHTGWHRVSDTFQIAIHYYNGASEMKIIFFQIQPILPFIQHYFWLFFLTAFWRWPLVRPINFCKRFWKLSFTCLRRPPSTAATSSKIACLSSWMILIRVWNTPSLKSPHKKSSGTLR